MIRRTAMAAPAPMPPYADGVRVDGFSWYRAEVIWEPDEELVSLLDVVCAIELVDAELGWSVAPIVNIVAS